MLIIDASSGIPLGISPVGLAVLRPASNRLTIFLEGGEGGGTVCEERPRKIALWTLYEQKKYGDLGIKHVCFIVRTRWGSAKHPNYGPIEKRSAEQKVPSKELRGFSVEVIVLPSMAIPDIDYHATGQLDTGREGRLKQMEGGADPFGLPPKKKIVNGSSPINAPRGSITVRLPDATRTCPFSYQARRLLGTRNPDSRRSKRVLTEGVDAAYDSLLFVKFELKRRQIGRGQAMKRRMTHVYFVRTKPPWDEKTLRTTRQQSGQNTISWHSGQSEGREGKR